MDKNSTNLQIIEDSDKASFLKEKRNLKNVTSKCDAAKLGKVLEASFALTVKEIVLDGDSEVDVAKAAYSAHYTNFDDFENKAEDDYDTECRKYQGWDFDWSSVYVVLTYGELLEVRIKTDTFWREFWWVIEYDFSQQAMVDDIVRRIEQWEKEQE